MVAPLSAASSSTTGSNLLPAPRRASVCRPAPSCAKKHEVVRRNRNNDAFLYSTGSADPLPRAQQARPSLPPPLSCQKATAYAVYSNSRRLRGTAELYGGSSGAQRREQQRQGQRRASVAVCAIAGGGPATTSDYQPGDLLGGIYTVRELLGRGTTGATYRVSPHAPGCKCRWIIPACKTSFLSSAGAFW